MSESINLTQMIGMHLIEAEKLAESLGHTCRVIERDGDTVIAQPFADGSNFVNLKLQSEKVIAYSIR